MNESKKSAVPPNEQETTISFYRDGKLVDVWTSDTTVMTKFDRKCVESPEDYKCIEVGKSLDGTLTNKRYTISNKKLVSFRNRNAKREMTEEQRAEVAERFRQARLSKSTH